MEIEREQVQEVRRKQEHRQRILKYVYQLPYHSRQRISLHCS